MPEKKRINATLLLYGPPDRMNALLVEEQLRMANGERSPLEAFTRRDSERSVEPQRRQWVSFRVDTARALWDPDDPWVISVYRMMNRLKDREKQVREDPGLDLGDMVSFEFVRVATCNLSNLAIGGPLRDMIEVICTKYHDDELAVRLQITD